MRCSDLRWSMLRCRSALLREGIAEGLGTAVLVILGDGAGAQTRLGNKGGNEYGGFLTVTIYWGIAVCMGIIVSGVAGKGHINPAVTLAMFIRRRINWKQLLVYSVMQYLGAFLGSCIIFGIYHEKLLEANQGSKKFVMGQFSQIFSTYPAVTHLSCFFTEVLGTGLLLLGIMAVTDPNNFKIPNWAHSFFIGSLVSCIIATYGLNCLASLNPARDLGPRFLLLIGGWGPEAFRANSFYFWLPVVGPYVGAIVGMVIYEVCIGAQLAEPDTSMYQVDAAPPLDPPLEQPMPFEPITEREQSKL